MKWQEDLQNVRRKALLDARERELHFRAGMSTPMASHAEGILRYGSFVGSTVDGFEELPRAMQYARTMIDRTEQQGKSVHNGHVVVADCLTGSKGRFTRSWHAPQGGLWGCLVHANTLMPRSALLLSLAVGVAACENFSLFGADIAAIRW